MIALYVALLLGVIVGVVMFVRGRPKGPYMLQSHNGCGVLGAVKTTNGYVLGWRGDFGKQDVPTAFTLISEGPLVDGAYVTLRVDTPDGPRYATPRPGLIALTGGEGSAWVLGGGFKGVLRPGMPFTLGGIHMDGLSDAPCRGGSATRIPNGALWGNTVSITTDPTSLRLRLR